MNGTQYENQFKAIGSLIKYSADRELDVLTAESDLETLASNFTNEYDAIASPLTSAIAMVNTRVSTLNSQTTLSRNVINSYLLNVTKPDLSSTGNTASAIIDDLIIDMVAESQTVLISGTFWTYFNSNYNKSLNSVASGETIDDAWAE